MAVLDRAVVVGVGSGAVADGPAAKIVALELWRRVGEGGIGACLTGGGRVGAKRADYGHTTFTSSRRGVLRAGAAQHGHVWGEGRAPGEKDSDSRLSTRTFLP